MLTKIVGRFSLKVVPKRKAFSKLKPKHVKYFKKILQSPEIKQDGIDSFNETYFREYTGQSKIVLLPKTTKKVSKILKYCNKHNLAVCP